MSSTAWQKSRRRPRGPLRAEAARPRLPSRRHYWACPHRHRRSRGGRCQRPADPTCRRHRAGPPCRRRLVDRRYHPDRRAPHPDVRRSPECRARLCPHRRRRLRGRPAAALLRVHPYPAPCHQSRRPQRQHRWAWTGMTKTRRQRYSTKPKTTLVRSCAAVLRCLRRRHRPGSSARAPRLY